MNWEFRLYLNTSIQLHRTTLWIVLIVWDINNHKTPMDLRIDIDRRNIYKGLVCLYFCSNTQYSTLVFTGIVAAASLPLVPPDTGLTLSQKKFQIFLQLPLTFLFTCTLFGEEYSCKETLAILSPTSQNSSRIISKTTTMWRKK